MITWILILTLYVDGYNSGGASVAAVNGFNSVEQCLAAGNDWIKQQNAAHKSSQTQTLEISAKALCVRGGAGHAR